MWDSLSLLYIQGLPGTRTLPEHAGAIPNSRAGLMAQITWEPFLKQRSPGYNCCHPSWPHHAEAELPLLRDPRFPLSGSWAPLSVSLCHFRKLPLAPCCPPERVCHSSFALTFPRLLPSLGIKAFEFMLLCSSK